MDSLFEVIQIVKRLRSDGGCPWDREQTLDSLKECLIEETYELVEVMSGDISDHREELGDVLLQVLMQSQIREENGDFSINDVASTLAAKLIRRHPHVFGDESCSNSSDVIRNWERIKSSEKNKSKSSLLDGIPKTLPALQKAQRVQTKAARVGFDWERGEQVIDKIEEEIGELREAINNGEADSIKDEIGDVIFSIINLCRFYNLNAEESLKKTIDKFIRRFSEVERNISSQGRRLSDCSLAEMDELWNEAKREE